jgi:hypothetical protein
MRRVNVRGCDTLPTTMKRAVFVLVFLIGGCKDEQPGEGTPYPGCEGVDHAAPCESGGICIDAGESTVCSPKCGDDTDCPAFGGASVHCFEKTYCEIACSGPADCPDGMVCEATKACAWPKS